jgi:hypothetical protein
MEDLWCCCSKLEMKTEEEERDSSFVFVLKFEFEIGVWWKAGRSTGFGIPAQSSMVILSRAVKLAGPVRAGPGP